MKKYYPQFLCIAISSVLILACEKEYLETEPTQYISQKQIQEASEKKPELQAANMAGVYSFMYTPSTGGTNMHEDFGQRAIDIYTDMLCSDMTMSANNYGWYRGILQLTSTTDYTSLRNYFPWRYYYRVIRGANTVIDGFGGTDNVPETELGRVYMGQAKATRAYAYFYLANLFSTEYNPDAEILPIYTNTTDPNQPLSTMEEVYALIEKDLLDALVLLDGFERTAKNEINSAVAQGLLAYAYMTMGNFTEAANLTERIISSGAYRIMDASEALGGFNDVATSGWMWGVDLTIDIGLNLVSWWGMVDIYTFSYASFGDPKVMDQGLYDQIPDNDVRKNQFLNNPTHPLHLAPYNKFYAPARMFRGQRNIESDYFYMRVAEMYLLNAEAHARLGNEVQAQTALKSLLEQRIPDTSYVDALSGQDLLDEIYLQTRIELWGEGRSYLAMKRNRATVTKGSNHAYFAGNSYAHNDEKLKFSIPIQEVLDNPHIDEN